LTAVGKKPQLSGVFDGAGKLALMGGAGAGFAAGKNFALTANKLAQDIGIAKGGNRDILGAKEANGATGFFHRLKRDVFNANFFIERRLIASGNWLRGG
jgi:hypothetical protein